MKVELRRTVLVVGYHDHPDGHDHGADDHDHDHDHGADDPDDHDHGADDHELGRLLSIPPCPVFVLAPSSSGGTLLTELQSILGFPEICGDFFFVLESLWKMLFLVSPLLEIPRSCSSIVSACWSQSI